MAQKPAKYFPFANGRYEIAPGLSKFGKDFSNGPADQRIFQIDDEFARYYESKMAARRECFDRYVCESRLSDQVRVAVAQFTTDRLRNEHPDRLAFSGDKCDSLDALACRIQEDFAIISTDSTSGDHWLSYLHLCAPNHWAAADKIGRSFATIHEPVAGIEPINRRAEVHVKAMVAAEQGLIRFAWGIGTDNVLNHHPLRDRETGARRFDPSNPRAFVRVERQTIWGLPPVGAALFTIRTYFIDCAELKRSNPSMRDALVAAIQSMTAESLVYKGLSPWRDQLLEWLKT